MLPKFIRWFVGLLFKLLARVEVIGLENVPAQGGALVAVNHLSRLDPPLVYALLKRDKVTALVADKYQHSPFFGWFVQSVHGIWIHREDADFRALKAARNALQDGWIVGIAPEGTRSQAGTLIEAKTGVAYLADKAGVPVIPVGISYTDVAMAELRRLRRPKIRVEIGKPFILPPVERRTRDADLQRNTEEIMARIAALLPPQYRGAYADHPRLLELLGRDPRQAAAPSD